MAEAEVKVSISPDVTNLLSAVDIIIEEFTGLRARLGDRLAFVAQLPATMNMANIDDAGRSGWPDRMDMIHQLHEAVYGHTGARPDSPKVVWEELLAKVREMKHWIGASQ